MKQVLRVLTIVTIMLWLSLGALVITIVYSASKVDVKIGDPAVIVYDESLIIQFPLVVKNRGYYEISNVNLTTVLYEPAGDELIKGQTIITSVPEGSERTVVHNMSVQVEDLTSRYEKFMLEDLNFTLAIFESINFGNILPFYAKYNVTFPWGAPLYNLSVEHPVFYDLNETSCELSFTLSFENHSPYLAVSGTIQVEVYNSNGEKIGEGVELVDVQPNSAYYKSLSVLVDSAKVTSSGTIQLTFETSMFDFGPLVFGYGETI